MICNECETVTHCLKNGCVPKQPSKDEALKLALEALKWVKTGMGCNDIDATITAIKQALSDATHLADSALERMAENARELGLMPRSGGDYEPVQQSRSDVEPVAWIVYAKGSRKYFTLTFDPNKVPEIYIGGEAVPLYTTPPNVATPLDETASLAAPAPEERKRKSAPSAWVGLTDEEKITRSGYDLHFAYLIAEVERERKGKNT